MSHPLFLRPAALALGICVSAALVVRAGQNAPSEPSPQTTFRSGVALVHVEVSVLDRNRLPVQGLSASDFTVLEEGRPRPVVAFTSVDLPTRERPPAEWMTRVGADVTTNDFAKAGRLIIIVMDRSVEPIDAPEAMRVAEATVDQLRPGDLAAVTWAVYGVPQNFTADRTLLLDAIHQPSLNLPGGGTAESAACMCGSCTVDALARIAEAVQNVQQRRKIMIFIGRRLPGGAGCGAVVDSMRQRFLRAAQAGNLTVHVVDPRGLETLAPSASAARAGPPPGAANLRRISSLLEVTDATGGRLVTRNDASQALPEVLRESSSYYILGFEPAYTGTDGRFRRISVNVNRPGVTVQSRRGYYAPGRAAPRPPKVPAGLPAPLVEALAGLWPKTDVRLSMDAAPIAVPGVLGGAAAVLLRVQQDLTPAGPLGDAALFDRPQPTTVSVLVGAFDSNGRSYGYAQQTLALTPRQVGNRLYEYEVASRLDLPPGRYEIRAAIEDSTLRQTASAYSYVTMPDFIRQYASLSGVFIEAQPGTAAAATSNLEHVLPAAATTRRDFARSDHVRAFLQANQGVGHPVMPGYVITEIINDRDQRVYQQEQRILPDAVNRRTRDLVIDVPVDHLTPGEYLLTVELRHGNATPKREVRFQVR